MMTMQQRYRRFNRRLAAGVALVLGLVAAVNIAVDPAGVWGTPTRDGFNANKPREELYERMAKAQAVMRLRPRAVILGSSCARLGLDPVRLSRLVGYPAYNLGMSAPTIRELAAYFHHALACQPALRDVVLELEPGLFQANTGEHERELGFEPGRLDRDALPPRDYVAHTLTFTALVDSVLTVRANHLAPAARAYGPEGQDLHLDWRCDMDREGTVPSFLWYLHQAEDDSHAAYDPATMASVADIVGSCRARGIRLVVVTSPSYALETSRLRVEDGLGAYEGWERDLAATTDFWEFGGYNPVTTQPFRPDLPYVDPVHFKPAVGDRLLDQAVGGVSDTFGERVTRATVDAHLAEMRVEEAAWRQREPGVLAALKGLR